ncbi:unnamed protein product [Paramecium octaurelia]|uniref:Uncharacterized protein n=1 Tax=Paramecium octaurelia TaxID=43137 RepID=A0A8S1XPR9_PAROT|nr:unnamed protein product [Paramecium octaurelia]
MLLKKYIKEQKISIDGEDVYASIQRIQSFMMKFYQTIIFIKKNIILIQIISKKQNKMRCQQYCTSEFLDCQNFNGYYWTKCPLNYYYQTIRSEAEGL